MFPIDPISLSAVASVCVAVWEPCASPDTLLWALERSGANLRSFSADIAFDRYLALEDEKERRKGRLALQGEGAGRRLGCRFREFIDGAGAKRESQDHWIYADGWLAEADWEHKSFTKRRVVAPGESWDPLKLGEGPFPLPFGQAEEEVRARFAIERAALPETPLIRFALGDTKVCGLRLTPKPTTALAKDASWVDVFYSAEAKPLAESNQLGFQLIPRVVVLAKPSGDQSTIVLTNPVMNAPLEPADQTLLQMPNPDPKEWSIDVREWHRPEAGPDTGLDAGPENGLEKGEGKPSSGEKTRTEGSKSRQEP
jgi:hypothetical protein